MHFIGSYVLSGYCIYECVDDIIYYIRTISVVYCSVRTTKLMYYYNITSMIN